MRIPLRAVGNIYIIPKWIRIFYSPVSSNFPPNIKWVDSGHNEDLSDYPGRRCKQTCHLGHITSSFDQEMRQLKIVLPTRFSVEMISPLWCTINRGKLTLLRIGFWKPSISSMSMHVSECDDLSDYKLKSQIANRSYGYGSMNYASLAKFMGDIRSFSAINPGCPNIRTLDTMLFMHSLSSAPKFICSLILSHSVHFLYLLPILERTSPQADEYPTRT